VDVFRTLEEYMKATARAITALDDPQFVGIGRWQGQRITDKLIERTVVPGLQRDTSIASNSSNGKRMAELSVLTCDTASCRLPNL